MKIKIKMMIKTCQPLADKGKEKDYERELFQNTN